MNKLIAKIAVDGRAHGFEEHLRGTVEFAGDFGCGEWGQLAGLWYKESII